MKTEAQMHDEFWNTDEGRALQARAATAISDVQFEVLIEEADAALERYMASQPAPVEPCTPCDGVPAPDRCGFRPQDCPYQDGHVDDEFVTSKPIDYFVRVRKEASEFMASWMIAVVGDRHEGRLLPVGSLSPGSPQRAHELWQRIERECTRMEERSLKASIKHLLRKQERARR